MIAAMRVPDLSFSFFLVAAAVCMAETPAPRMHRPKDAPPSLQMLVPGFTVRTLPVDLTNFVNLQYRHDGVLVAFPRYEEGLRDFRDRTYPLLKQAGLRDFL